MGDALVLIVGDWRQAVLGTSFAVFFALFLALVFFSRNRAGKYPEIRERFSRPLWLYCIFGVFLCQVVVGHALNCVKLLLDASPDPSAAGWATLGVGAAYAAALFRSLCRLVTVKPNGLRLTRLFLLSFPLFIVALPFAACFLGAARAGDAFSFTVSRQESLEALLMGCMFSLPWLLYFSLSKELKKAWADVERRQAKERAVIFPD